MNTFRSHEEAVRRARAFEEKQAYKSDNPNARDARRPSRAKNRSKNKRRDKRER